MPLTTPLMRRLTLAFCGCGSRARTYAGIAAEMPDCFDLVAGADVDARFTVGMAGAGVGTGRRVSTGARPAPLPPVGLTQT